GKNPPVKQADFRSFYTCLTASRCKGFERILIKGLAPIFDIIRSNSLYVLDFLFVQQSLSITSVSSYLGTILAPTFSRALNKLSIKGKTSGNTFPDADLILNLSSR